MPEKSPPIQRKDRNIPAFWKWKTLSPPLIILSHIYNSLTPVKVRSWPASESSTASFFGRRRKPFFLSNSCQSSIGFSMAMSSQTWAQKHADIDPSRSSSITKHLSFTKLNEFVSHLCIPSTQHTECLRVRSREAKGKGETVLLNLILGLCTPMGQEGSRDSINPC